MVDVLILTAGALFVFVLLLIISLCMATARRERAESWAIAQRVKLLVPSPWQCAHCERQVFMPRPKVPLCPECAETYKLFLQEVPPDGRIHYQD